MRAGRMFIPTREWHDRRQIRGMAGERAAWAFLTACGWEVEAHRFRWGHHDLDLVIRREYQVAFVEVKTRRSLAFGMPVEAVGRRKRLIIARLAELWRLRYGLAGDEYRFDVVGVRELGRGRYDIEHVADAWRLVT
jgi:putative endonuclease